MDLIVAYTKQIMALGCTYKQKRRKKRKSVAMVRPQDRKRASTGFFWCFAVALGRPGAALDLKNPSKTSYCRRFSVFRQIDRNTVPGILRAPSGITLGIVLGVFGDPGALLGALGTQWAPLCVLGTLLGRSWDGLGRILDALGPGWDAIGARSGIILGLTLIHI